MKYRKLRIAWSVGWGVLCITLIAFWVRSYWRWDAFTGNLFGDHVSTVDSAGGRLVATDYIHPAANEESLSWDSYDNVQIGEGRMSGGSDTGGQTLIFEPQTVRHGFGVHWSGDYHAVYVPHWFLAVLVALVAGLSWLPWRFTLRTLLIGMTVAAVGLGWLVYVSRN